MLRKFILICAGVGALAACTETGSTGSAADPIAARLAGKTLVNDRANINVNRDGSLSGTLGAEGQLELAGSWAIRDGQWCRTLSKPDNLVGTACQDITFNDDGTVTIVGTNGPGTFVIE